MPHALLLALLLGLTPVVCAQSTDLFAPGTVRSFYLTFKDPNWWALLGQNKSAGIDIKADLKVDQVTLTDIGVRFKGNTSYSYNPNSQKKPFNLRFDAFVPGQKLYGYEHVNLQNAYKDATFLREPLSYELMRRYFSSLKSCWIKLYLNGTYWGVYVMVQQANTRFLGENFAVSRGNLYRGDSVNRNTRPVFRYWGTNVSSYSRLYDYKTVGHPQPWQDLITFCDALNNTPLANLPAVIEQHLDVDQALWYIAIHNILVNVDSYLGTGNDYYAYHDERHDQFVILSWDLNTAFGGYDWRRTLGNNRHLMSPYYSGGSSIRPLIERLLAVPEYRERYLAHLRTLLDEFFDWQKLGPLATQYHKLLEPHVRADTKKLYSTQQFYDNLTVDVTVSDRYGSYVIPGLKSFVDKRRAYLLAHADISPVAPGLSLLSRSHAAPRPSDRVYVSVKVAGVPAQVVTLYSRTRGAWTQTRMLDDGMHGDGAAKDGVFGALVPHNDAGYEVQYYVGAATSAGTIRFLPSHAGVGPETYRVAPVARGPLRINEFLADNDSVDQDAAGDFEDWVEIHNTSNTAVDISGYFLTDRLDDPRKYRFPANTILPPRGFLRVWCDEEPGEGPDHADFKLAKSGEQLALFDSDTLGTNLLHAVAYGEQRSDTSFGLMPDGGDHWVHLFDPSGGRGQAAPGALVRFDARRKGSASGFALGYLGAAEVGKTLSLELSGGPAQHLAMLGLALDPLQVDLGPLGLLNIDPARMVVVPLALDQNGARSFVNFVPAVASGLQLYAQALAADLSNALSIRFK